MRRGPRECGPFLIARLLFRRSRRRDRVDLGAVAVEEVAALRAAHLRVQKSPEEAVGVGSVEQNPDARGTPLSTGMRATTGIRE